MSVTERLRATASVYAVKLRNLVVSLVQYGGLALAVGGVWQIFYYPIQVQTTIGASIPPPPTGLTDVDGILLIAMGLAILYYPSRRRTTV